MSRTEEFELIIVGGGPAGLCAAMYAGRGMLRAVLLERGVPGGELLNTEWVDDYPGFEHVLGRDLAHKMTAHARAFGADADYLVIGTVFATSSHPGREPGGPELVARVVAATSRPVLAIGGITVERVAGVTGARATLATGLREYVERVKMRANGKPVVVGFGISTAEQVREVGQFADGVIVASALIRAAGDALDPAAAAYEFVQGLRG